MNDIKIGLEIHIPLPTTSKLFCRCPNRSTDENPNTNVCPVCMGLPGSRPYLNKRAVIWGIKIAKILNCKMNNTIFFSRKTYFYPDLPKNYQITQYEAPIGEDGFLKLLSGKEIRISRVHLEEDPGRLKYTKDNLTLVDYNRSGSPLIEVVTKPDISNEGELREFLNLLVAYLEYSGLEGVKDLLRCDVNVSLSHNVRVEIKNVNGIKNIVEAAHQEIERQRRMLEAGITVRRETLMFDSERKMLITLRSKEFEEDYGYIFEPDLPIFEIKGLSKTIKVPKLPDQIYKEFLEKYKVSSEEEDKIKRIIFSSKSWTELLLKVTEQFGYSHKLLSIVFYLFENMGEKPSRLCGNERFKKLIKEYLDKDLAPRFVKETAEKILHGEKVELSSSEVGEKDIEKIVCDFLEKNPQILNEVKMNPKAINFIVGKIIKEHQLIHLAKVVHKVVSRIVQKKIE